MQVNQKIEHILDLFHERKLPHAFLLETNDYEKCLDEIKSLISRMIDEKNIDHLINIEAFPSLIIIRPEGNTIKKEQILYLKDSFSKKPIYSDYNFYIIMEAEKLNKTSANSLLKFVEEPEGDIIGFFITNNKEQIISTIYSRCQIYKLKYEIQEQLHEEELCKSYLFSLYNNNKEMLFLNRKFCDKIKDRIQISNFFSELKKIYYNALNGKIDSNYIYLKEVCKENILFQLELTKKILKRINYNVNSQLLLDYFVLESRC